MELRSIWGERARRAWLGMCRPLFGGSGDTSSSSIWTHICFCLYWNSLTGSVCLDDRLNRSKSGDGEAQWLRVDTSSMSVDLHVERFIIRSSSTPFGDIHHFWRTKLTIIPSDNHIVINRYENYIADRKNIAMV